MPEMHLKQIEFTYSACSPFTKNKKRIQIFMETGSTNYIYKNNLDKACFQRDIAHDEYKDLTKSAKSDKFLRDKAIKIVSNSKNYEYKRVLASMVYKICDKKCAGSGIKSISYQ